MDIATALASIVSLLSNFKSERKSQEKDSYDDFLLWLSDKRHKELVDEINLNYKLELGIKSLLKNNHDEVIGKLKTLESSMLAVSAHISGLKEISEALAPNKGLSDQAFSIIKQLHESGGSFFIEIFMGGGTVYGIMDPKTSLSSIHIDEPQFIKEDLNQLVNLELLLLENNKKGDRVFRFTRSAKKLVEAS